MAAHLFVQRVKKLLPGSRAGKGRAVIERWPPNRRVIEQAFRRAV